MKQNALNHWLADLSKDRLAEHILQHCHVTGKKLEEDDECDCFSHRAMRFDRVVATLGTITAQLGELRRDHAVLTAKFDGVEEDRDVWKQRCEKAVKEADLLAKRCNQFNAEYNDLHRKLVDRDQEIAILLNGRKDGRI